MSLLDNKIFVFAVLMTICINATFLVGVSHYQSNDVNGVPITTPILNNYGYVLLAAPLLLYILYYLKKRRWTS